MGANRSAAADPELGRGGVLGARSVKRRSDLVEVGGPLVVADGLVDQGGQAGVFL
jgi:hypothetical protein